MKIELEQYLGRGEETVFLFFTLKTLGGVAAGFFGGQTLGSLVFTSGISVLLTGICCAVLGFAIMTQYHGLLIARRIWLALRYHLRRRARGAAELDGSAWYTVVADEPARATENVEIYSQIDGRPLLRAAREPAGQANGAGPHGEEASDDRAD